MELLDHSILVPDASAILRLYECGSDDRECYLDAFTRFSGRTWLANRTRVEVIRRLQSVRQRNRVNTFNHVVKTFPLDLSHPLSSFKRRKDIEPAYDPMDVLEPAMNDFQVQYNELRVAFLNKLDIELQRKEADAFRTIDQLIDQLLADKNVGKPLDHQDLAAVLRQGPNRYANSIPPGFADRHKHHNREPEDIFGDLIFWEEILRFTSSYRRPVIIVTAEEKQDWWIRRRYGVEPHPLMVMEMRTRAGQRLCCLRLCDFASIVAGERNAKTVIQVERTFPDLSRRLSHVVLPSDVIRSVSAIGKHQLYDTSSRITADALGHFGTSFAAMRKAQQPGILASILPFKSHLLPDPLGMLRSTTFLSEKAKLAKFLSDNLLMTKWQQEITQKFITGTKIAESYALGLPNNQLMGLATPTRFKEQSFILASVLGSKANRMLDISNFIAPRRAAMEVSLALHAAFVDQAPLEFNNPSDEENKRNNRRRAIRMDRLSRGICTRCGKADATFRDEGRQMATCFECRLRRPS